MAVHIAGNLQGLIDEGAAKYIIANTHKFKSTTPGPIGPTGPIGPQGEGVHHMKGTSTTDSEGDFSSPGEKDTYTFYADANEEFPLAWFTVANGLDAYNYALLAGYTGSELDFYQELANVRKYYEESLAFVTDTEAYALSAAINAASAAADKNITLDAKEETLGARDIAVASSEIVQSIFLGAKDADPALDNEGNALVIGTMYYNTLSGTLRIWDGIKWGLGAFSVAGAVLSVNGMQGNVELTKDDMELSDVDNTSDMAKPVSTLQKEALDLKADVDWVIDRYETVQEW